MAQSVPLLLTRPPFAGARQAVGREGALYHLVRSAAVAARDGMQAREAPWRRKSGHHAVTSGLLRGLNQLERSYLYNRLPGRDQQPRAIGVLAGTATLSWANEQLESWPGTGLYVGPNVFVAPRAFRDQLLSPQLAGVVVPSDWVARVYEEQIPELRGKLMPWAAGVDTKVWSPGGMRNQGARRCLIYSKGADPSDVELCADDCRKLGWSVNLIQYGRYTPRSYLSKLRCSDVMVVLGGSESQGLALFEAWSVNVPTLVRRWVPKVQAGIPNPDALGELGRTCSAPYLSRKTGSFWETREELGELLAASGHWAYEPRNWVMERATSKLAADRYWNLLHSG